jgi:hypothetical protein
MKYLLNGFYLNLLNEFFPQRLLQNKTQNLLINFSEFFIEN